jgi:hypothetical protein
METKMNTRNHLLAIGALAGLFLLPTQQAWADTYSFDNCVTTNSSYCTGSVPAGYQALGLTTSTSGSETVLEFTHDGSDQAEVHEIYLDFGTLINTNDVTLEQTNVVYKIGANPSDPPGLNNPGFIVSLAVDSHVGGGQPDGLGGNDGTGEALRIIISQVLNFDNFVSAIHVGGLSDGTSDTFTTSAVPLPAAAWLFGSGLVGLLALAGKRRKGGLSA